MKRFAMLWALIASLVLQSVAPAAADAQSRFLTRTVFGGGQPIGVQIAVPVQSVTGVIFAGDSITKGYPNYGSAPPTLFASDTSLPVINNGVDGAKIQRNIDTYQTEIVANFSPTRLNRVLTVIGINDILTGATASYITGKIMELHALNAAAGIPSDFGTLTACGPSYSGGFNESVRLAVNDFIRARKADGTFSVVVDFAADPRLQDPTNASVYSDQLHFTAAGNAIRANIIEAAYGLGEAPAAPTLTGLTVSPNTATVGTVFSGTISGKTASSSIALVNGDGLAVSGTSITGTPTTAGSLGLIETLAGASNSPRTSSNVVTIGSGTTPPTPAGVTFALLAGNTTASNLSNGNKTFKGAHTGGGQPRAAAITSLPIAGKMLFAASFDSNATNGEKRFGLIGVSTTRVTSGGSGFDADSAALFTDLGQMFVGGNGGPNIPTPVVGDNQAMYVDLAAAKLWYTKDGTNWYGTAGPLTLAQVNAGSSGVDISTAKAQGTLYFVVGERDQTGFQWTAMQAWPFGASTRPTGAVYIGE